MQLVVLILCIFLFYPAKPYAYIGPGLGLGALGAILGLVFSILLAILGIFWYPIKRLIGKIRSKKKGPHIG
jgi:hypothetical protein